MKLLRLNLSKNERQSIKIINNFLTVVQIIKKMFKTAQITQKKKKKTYNSIHLHQISSVPLCNSSLLVIDSMGI